MMGKVTRVTYIFYRGDVTCFKVWDRGRAIGVWYYPLTYTIQECIEVWCESKGHRFFWYKVNDHEPWHEYSMESGAFKFLKAGDE